jgi:hypothetical protein
MAQSDFTPFSTAESKIDSLKAVFHGCFQLPGGEGGGFHVANGKMGVHLRSETTADGQAGLQRLHDQALAGAGLSRRGSSLFSVECRPQLGLFSSALSATLREP